jgi:hypothetical protein
VKCTLGRLWPPYRLFAKGYDDATHSAVSSNKEVSISHLRPIRLVSLSTDEGAYTLGWSADTWGRAWGSGDFSDANLRVRLTNVAGNTPRDFSLDRVAVQLRYQ